RSGRKTCSRWSGRIDRFPPLPRSRGERVPVRDNFRRDDPRRGAPGSWQRIGGESPPRGRSSQPPRPRVMHEVLLARAAVKRSQGRPRAKYGAAKRVYFRGADLVPLKRRQHRPMTYWLAWDEPRAVGDLVHVETFFAGNLGGLIHARTRMPA